jgi:Tfp pilus assembly protein PilF
MGMTYAEMGRYEDATGEMREAVRVDPDYVEAYTNLASVYYKTGKYEKAVLAWINAVLLKPELIEDVPENLLLKVRRGVTRLSM